MGSRTTDRRTWAVIAVWGVAMALLTGACTGSGSVGTTTSTAEAPSPSSGSSSGPTAGEVVADVVLVPDPECRNGGAATVGTEQWHVLVRQPASWRDQPAVVGTLEIRGERGLFTDVDDHAVAVTRGPVEASCDVWPGD